MNLPLLFFDELRGFYKSKVMIVLWVGLPLMAILLFAWSPDVEDIPLSAFTALLVSSISGTLASVMLVVSIVNERERHVYDLLVIRPIERRDIVLSKFMAVFVCVSIAASFALVLGLVVDHFNSDVPIDVILDRLLDSVIISMSALAVVSAAGVLIGIVSPSILVGAVLVIYGGNQISSGIAAAAVILFDSHVYTVALSITLTVLLLVGSIILFNRQQF